MVSLFQAEWKKITGNRWPMAMFVGVFPVGFTIMIILMVVLSLFSSDFREYQRGMGIDSWDRTMVGVWEMANIDVARWMFTALTAVIFAGEYQYGTWKNLAPRKPRFQLIITKFVTIVVLILSVWIFTSLILLVGAGVIAAILDVPYGHFDAQTIRHFLSDYALQMAITLTSIFMATGYAALAVMLSRNILISVFVAILINILEIALIIPLLLAKNVLELDLMVIYKLMPGYNLSNINSWAVHDKGYEFFDLLEAFSMPVSVVIVVLWVVGIIGFTIYSFVRQDITT